MTGTTQKASLWRCGFLIGCILIGLVAACVLVGMRMVVEQQEKQVAMIVDHEAALRYASYERTPQDIYENLRSHGVTALAIYDKTLEKLADQGYIRLAKGSALPEIPFTDGEGGAKPGKTYVLLVPGEEAYFEETKASLIQRLGVSQVHARPTMYGWALELSPPYESLVDMNLSLSRIEAERIEAHGFDVVARPSNFKNETRADVDFVLHRLEGLHRVVGIVFVGKEVLGYPNDISYLAERLHAMHIPVVGIEATSQLQYEPQAGFTELAALNGYAVGRLYTIPKDYLKKLSPDRVSQMFYITDVERNVRYNLLPLFETGLANHTALQTSLSYISVVRDKLEARGYSIGKPSIYPVYDGIKWMLILTMLGVWALAIRTATALYPLRFRTQGILLMVGWGLSALALIYTHGNGIRTALALMAAITAPAHAMIVTMDAWTKRPRNSAHPWWKLLFVGGIYSVIAACIALIGGLFIAALLGSTPFFMEFSLFRGVKLTFIAPVVIVALAYCQRFPVWKGQLLRTRAQGCDMIRSVCTADIKVYTLLGILFLLFVAWVFIGRSGHTEGVPVPQWEIAMRHALETFLYARPREKEFLIGYPAMLCAVFAWYHRWPLSFHFLATMGATIGLGSMVETFAHVRTPVLMSLVRGWNGLWSGLLVGILVCTALVCVTYGVRRYRQRGDGHA